MANKYKAAIDALRPLARSVNPAEDVAVIPTRGCM